MNPPPVPPSGENNNSIAHQAAKASLFTVLIAILAAVAGAGLAHQSHNPTQVALLFDLFAGVVIIAGFVGAIIALAGIGAYGPRGLLGRGLAGLTLNGILLVIFTVNFMQARQKAEERRKVLADMQSTSSDIRADMKKSFDPKMGITNVDTEKVDRLSKQLKNASQNLSGDDARIASVMAAFLDRTHGALKTYQDAVTQMREAHVLGQFDPADKGQFTAKRQVVQKFLQANSDLTHAITNAEDNIRSELAKAQVSKANIESVIAGYNSSAAPVNSITLQIRQCDDRMGNAMLDALNTLETQWGHWKFDATDEKLVFEDSDTREAYNKSIRAMKAAADDEVKWQAKLVSRQRAQP